MRGGHAVGKKISKNKNLGKDNLEGKEGLEKKISLKKKDRRWERITLRERKGVMEWLI